MKNSNGEKKDGGKGKLGKQRWRIVEMYIFM